MVLEMFVLSSSTIPAGSAVGRPLFISVVKNTTHRTGATTMQNMKSGRREYILSSRPNMDFMR